MNLTLIDATGVMYRMFHGIPPMNAGPGMNVNAVYGYIGCLLSWISKGDRVVAVFDPEGLTFRDELLSEYKQARKRPDGLGEQFEWAKRITPYLGVDLVSIGGFEADDVISTFADEWLALNLTKQVTVVTVDKDLMQIVQDPYVQLFNPQAKQYIYEDAVVHKFGVRPKQVAMVQALMGDPTDGIPGVKGIGIGGARTIVRQYPTIDLLFKAIEAGTAPQARPYQLVAAAGKEYLAKMLRLTNLVGNIPNGSYEHDIVKRHAGLDKMAMMPDEAIDVMRSLSMNRHIDTLQNMLSKQTV